MPDGDRDCRSLSAVAVIGTSSGERGDWETGNIFSHYFTIYYPLPPTPNSQLPTVTDLDRLGTLNHIRYMDRDLHGILADNRTRNR
jgi:hypothetical protein